MNETHEQVETRLESDQHVDFGDADYFTSNSFGELTCQKVGCYRRAAWSVIADRVTDSVQSPVITCDEHLVEVGLMTRAGNRDAICWTVWPFGLGPVS